MGYASVIVMKSDGRELIEITSKRRFEDLESFAQKVRDRIAKETWDPPQRANGR